MFIESDIISALADVLGVSERILLSGKITRNSEDSGNMRKLKFYLCPECGSVMQGMGECSVVCCSKNLEPLKPMICDDNHPVTVSFVEDDYYLEFNHPMTKEHFINFVAFASFDRVLFIKLYPEQDPVVRFPKTSKGKIFFCCNNHGLFEYKI